MALDHNAAGENSLSLVKPILGLLVVTYFLWYIGGGPERWNNKYESINKEIIRDNVAGKGVFIIEN